MGVAERFNEKKKKTTGIYNGVEHRLRAKSAEQVGKEISSRVNTWLENNKYFVTNYQNRYKAGSTGYRADASDWLNKVTYQKSNFDSEAENIKSVLNDYKDYFDPEWVNEVIKTLDSGVGIQSQILSDSEKDSQFWSQWDSADAYNRDKTIWDISKMTAEDVRKNLNGNNPVAYTTADGYDVTWESIYKSKAREENEARIMSAADFEAYSTAGAAKGEDTARWWEFWEKPENNIAQMRNDPDLMASYEKTARESDGAMSPGIAKNAFLDQISYKAAKYMTDNEYKIYNYYIGKGDTEQADAYLSSIEEDLNMRQAGQMVSDVQGNRIKELAFAFEAGTNQFITGMRSLDNWITGSAPDLTPAVQYANAEIAGSMKGGWKIAYDLTSTTANMLPSILVSTIPVPGAAIAGTASMGLSAAGNAYNEMRNLGYDDGAAQNYAFLVGVSESTLQYLLGGISSLGGKASGNVIAKVVSKIDNALARVAIKLGGSMLSEGVEESLQAVLEPVFKMLTTGEDFEGIDIEEVVYSGLLGALSAGLLEGGSVSVGEITANTSARDTYGANSADLVAEALEIDPNNTYAQKLQAKIDSGKSLTGAQINRLVEMNESALVAQDTTKVHDAAVNRLTELGETGDVEAIATVLTKQAIGERLSVKDRAVIRDSKFGQRVSNELNTKNIESGEYTSKWAESIGTNRINAEEYGRVLADLEAEDAAIGTQEATEAPAATIRETQTVEEAPVERVETVENTVEEPVEIADEAETVDVAESVPAMETAVEVESEAVETSETVDETTETNSTVALEEASTKYGAQAGAMVHTYIAGQDVAQYDAAYKAAYDMGAAGVSLSYAMNSDALSYLTDSQRQIAYETGKAASDTTAQAKDAKNKAAANGKTGRRKGTVKGEGVTVAELQKTFNDTQGTAYKLLSTYAEATGIDIVLFKSEANAEGDFEGAQGKFKWSEDTIYIDLNAGLANIKSMDDVAKYTMLRTFAHEFTHFIEKWNPVQYNEFRRVVFDTMTERGENVHELILRKQEQSGLDYEKASREVMAEAMTDILPDANFVEQLAENHKTIFNKLLEKLKEFVADLKVYFKTIGANPSREARALKEQVGESVKYVESIVALFDRVAVEAVENYQRTVATEEAVETVTPEATVSKTETTTDEGNGDTFTITDNAEYGTLEIKFDGKPSEAVREALKARNFRWHRKKGVWYGKAERADIIRDLREAYKTEAPVEENVTEQPTSDTPATQKHDTIEEKPSDFETAFWNASQEERDEVIEAINENTKISHMMPTEIRGEKPTSTVEEVNSNVEDQETGSVLRDRSDGEGDARLLAELQTPDVQRNGAERDAVDGAQERGHETGRPDLRSDAEGSERGPSEGSSESRDLRRDDGLTEESAQETDTLHEEVVEEIARKSTEKPRGRNFVIGDSLDLPNGEKARYKANVEAIRLVKQLEAEGRYATEAEQGILSKYVGWGGLANAFDARKADWAKEYAELSEILTKEEYESARGSTLNAHYTDISVIKAMYDGLSRLGFEGGRMLEPSSGVGNFVGAMPATMSEKVKSWTMVELDGITGLIAKYLYPNADVRIQGFEKANIPDNFMDVVISNVPFGNYAIADKAYPKRVTSAIHNYFFAKSLDKVRPGGIVMFITSSYTMNAKDNAVRRYIMSKADLLGAIRLPDSAFKGNAGTEVVTDILVLKKREANTPYAGVDFLEAPWTRLQNESYNGAYINNYFTAHPEMVLGTATMSGSMYRGDSLTYKAFTDRGSLADQIREAFSHIEGKMDYPAQVSREKTNFAVERASKGTKQNGLVVKDGKVYQNKDGELVEKTVAKGAAERISGMLDIRDAARDLMNFQQQGLSESEIKKARTKLNKAYDAFVKKYGYINAQANKNAISEDPDKFSIFALENWDSDTKKATKADIFTKNTISPNRTVTSAKDVSEGLIVSVNQTGGVDTALIARLTGKTEADVTRELIDGRIAFKNRNGNLEAAEVYLSGNVRAKLRDAEAMVPMDADYQNNVEALKAVMPEDVSYQDIFVNPGTPWIPNSVYSDFAAYMLGGHNNSWRQDVDITRNADTGNFTIELKSRYLKTNAANTQKWGTPRRSFLDLFDAMLNSKSVVVKDKLDDGSFVVNKDATAAANEKIENIQKEFQEWLWKDEGRRTELATLYNETFNSIVTPKYNGDNLTVNGANALKPLRSHQRNAVQRVISSGGNTLLAHKVGAGKTYEMAAAAMKLKELGLVKKPLFAVPKSLVAQWGVEFKDFFPTAKLLVAEASDFTAANRKVFMNRIANGEYDAVIVSYEQFEKLPMSDDFTRELYQEQIDSVVAAIEEAKAEKGDKALSIKDLEKKRKSLQTKIDKLTDKAKDEDNIDFEGLGVDSLFVDEAHNFKNLFYTTSMTNVSGLGNKDGSKRAFDLYTKVRYLQQLNGGRGIVFATATPVMNSMSEMYIMQKYLQPDLLNQLGLSTFDAWAKQFGEVVNGVEIKPSGQGYRVKQSFSRFKNMSELQLLFRNFADVLTDIPGLKIPTMKGGKVNVVVCEPGQFQQDYMKELEQRADNIKNVDPSVDNMLKITSDGRKISYTQRMIDPSLPYEEGCKIFRCADNVVKGYNESKAIKGTQLIFLDMATPKGKSKTETTTEDADLDMDMENAQLYDDLKARLIAGGIPSKEIAFIHDADTDQKKKKLFADVNDGKVRVLIGSTGKMGVGMNAQKRVVAIHHLDAPWRPGDVEQRNGRAFRQGNINDEVENFTYVTEGSFDARLWDILERKQNFINQIMNGESVGRETEDTGEVTLSAAEVKALASGSPLIMEQVQLDTDIKKLESLYRSHVSAVRAAKEKLSRDKGSIATLESFIEDGKADIAARKDTYSEGNFSITVGKMKYTDKKEAGVALMAQATAKANEQNYTTIATFAGFELQVIKTSEGIKGMIQGVQGYPFNTYPNNTTFMITHLISAVEGIENRVKMWEQSLIDTRADMAEQEKMMAEPFAKQAELDQKRARYNEVMAILNPKEEQSLDGVDEDTVQEQSREYLREEALGEFGTTTNFDQAGFALPDGRLLKLSQYGQTGVQHRIIERIYEDVKGDEAIARFIQDGNVRISAASPGIEISAEHSPTVSQLNTISRFVSNSLIRRGVFYLDITGQNGESIASVTYDDRYSTSEIIYDIKDYYKRGKIPQPDSMYDDFVQEQSRSYLTDDYPTDGVHWGIKAGIMSKADARIVWEAIANIDKKGYNSYQRTINGEYFVEGDDVLMVVDVDYRNPVVKTIFKFRDNESYAKEVLINARGIEQEVREAKSLIETVYGEGYVEQYDFKARGTYEGENGRGKGNHSGADFEGKIQHQQRTNTLTDREVLSMAADRLEEGGKLTDGERDALHIFKERLSTLEALQVERAEQGALYKKQQFAKPTDREAAAQTLNRMHILDDKIKAASEAVLTVENKQVLGGVLKKARKVVEEQERQHGKEMLDRWRDRTKNAAAIKKYRERIQADVTELSSWILKPNNKDIVKHVPDALKNTVIPFLTSIDFTSKQQLRGKEATKADQEFVKRLEALKGALKENMDVTGLYSGYNDLPPNFMDNLQIFIDSIRAIVEKNSGEFVVNRMTADELHELSKVVRALKKYITQINRFHANAMFQHVYEAGDNTIESLAVMDSNNGKSNGVSNFLFWQQMRPAYAFERFGEGGKAIYDGLRRGQAQLAFNTHQIVDFTKKAYTEKEVKAWEKEVKEIELGGHIVKMRVSHMMSFYELSKQKDSLRHMLKGGVRVATYTERGKKISDNGHIVTEADVQTIIDALTPRQKEVADNLQKFMAEQGGAWGNHVSVARFGEELFTNEQYFPINSDGRHLQSNADENPSAASLYALLNMSFTKSRNENANNRIVLYSIFDVFSNHMASMAQYNAMALPVLDALKWFNYQQKAETPDGERYIIGSVREQMTRVYGVPEESRPGSGRQGYAESFVLNILKAFNGTEAQGIPSDTLGMNATRRYNLAQVAYNLRVVVQQPLAITRAALLIDYGSIMKGLKLNPKAIQRNIEEMRKYSGIAAWKSLGFYDVNISRGLSDIIKHKSTIGDKISDVGMWGAEKADMITWAGLWSAAKAEVTKKQGLKPGQDGFYEAVTTLFEDIIYKTQVVDSILTKNEFMRSKGFFARAIGSFMSEPTTTASMVLNAYDKYHMDMQSGMSRQQSWKKNGKLIGRTLYVYGVTQVLLAAVTAAMDAWRDDDEYETFLEKWLEQFGGNLVDELMPFNKLPILSDFYDLAKQFLSIFGVDTYGNPPQSIFMQWYDSLIKGTEIIYERITGEDTNYTWYGGIYKLLQAVSGMSGLPMAAATREIITIWNNTVGSMAPSLKLETYDSGDMNEIKYAYADGYLTDEEAVALLLEKGLVDNEDEAYFTIQGWEAGEGYSRFDAIYDAVLNGGDFEAAMGELTSHGYDEKDVLSMIKSQIGRWYSDEESTVRISKQQAISMLEKYTDLNDEEITKAVNKWSSKVVTGIAYDDIDDEFMEGNITAARATEMYRLYGSMTQEDATKKVTVLAFVKEHPECEGISYAAVEGYKLYSEPLGVDASLFYDVWQYNTNAKADVDKKGQPVSGSKKAKVLDYIDSLNLSNKQKDSIYYAFGWAKSTIKEAPWR